MSAFLQSVLSDEGYPIVAILNGDGDKAYMRNLIMNSKDELIERLPELYLNNKGVYFSLATFKDYAEPTKSNPALKGYRTTSKVVAYRSFFTEVDIRTDKDDCYNTVEEAIEGIDDFLEKTSLPAPTTVSTGGGFHLYWLLTEDVDLDKWREWSNKLIAVANHIGFKLDVAGTNKPTQIFRPPESPNNKYEPPYTVAIQELQKESKPDKLIMCLDDYMGIEKLNAPKAVLGRKRYVHDNEIPLRDWTKIESKCAQVRVAATGSEEQWRGLLSIARLCKTDKYEGDDLCHKLSEVDPRYSPSDTDHKLETMADQLAGTDGMPYACSSFDKMNPGVCQQCLSYNRVKSPIVLGIIDIAEDMVKPDLDRALPQITEAKRETKSEKKTKDSSQSEDDEDAKHVVPEGGRFAITDDGLVMSYTVYDKESNSYTDHNELICKQKLYPLEIILGKNIDGNTQFSYLWRVEPDKGKTNDAIIGGEVFTKVGELVAVFAGLGVNIIKSTNHQHFAQAMRSFISSARDEFEPKQVKKHLGWYDDCMVYGAKTITKSGDIRRSILNGEMQSLVNETLTEAGTYEKWRESIKPYEDRDQPLPQMVLATAFAGPLIQFSTIKGVLISLVGESGCGKSTMQEVAASVWGNPRNQLQNAVGTKTGDTVLSVTRWMGGLNNLTVHLEELSNMSDSDASDLAYLITQGAEKNRMQQAKDDGYKRSLGMSWKTMVTCSTNEAIRDKISRSKLDHMAESMRLIEITDIPTIQADWAGTGDKLEGVRENYGHAGEMYVTELMERKPQLKDEMKVEVDQINHDLDTRSPERFWVQGIAAILIGARIATEAGIFPFNLDEIREYLYRQITIQRSYNHTADLKSQTIFADMMNDILSETLVVADSGLNETCEVRKMPFSKLNARVDTRKNLVWISTRRVSQYAKENQLSVTNILQDARENQFLRSATAVRVTLGKGVPDLPSTQSMCYELQLPSEIIDSVAAPQKPDIKEILEGVVK